MPRPNEPSDLNPRKPYTALCWAMQKQRLVAGDEVVRIATDFGVDKSHISRVENAKAMPSRSLVNFYDDRFQSEGLLASLYEVAIEADEQARRRARGTRPKLHHAVDGDASEFVCDTIPHGTLFEPGEMFEKTWTLRNVGSVEWVGRQLERQGPLTGPGLISSARYVPIADTKPGEEVTIRAELKAPTYECSSIAYFKMVDAAGALCFPEEYQLGLDLVVLVQDDS